MRCVLDTNVIISALWKPGSVPDQAVTAALENGGRVLYDSRILIEYRSVLARPKFKRINPAHAAALISRIESHGEAVADVARWTGVMPDDDDRMFVEVALTGRADVIITGNERDFPSDLGFIVKRPATLVTSIGTRQVEIK